MEYFYSAQRIVLPKLEVKLDSKYSSQATLALLSAFQQICSCPKTFPPCFFVSCFPTLYSAPEILGTSFLSFTPVDFCHRTANGYYQNNGCVVEEELSKADPRVAACLWPLPVKPSDVPSVKPSNTRILCENSCPQVTHSWG